MPVPIRVILEVTSAKTFATAADWPGWSRGARTEAEALASLAAYAPRYAPVARAAGFELPPTDPDDGTFDVVDRVEGSSGTSFGVPSHVAPSDREPLDEAGAARRAALVEAAWTTFERIARDAPAGLRKGPRGGGRDTAKIVTHVEEADRAYAAEIGIPVELRGARADLATARAAILAVLRRPTDGSPLAGRRWTARYAAARVAWHALDHAWEIEDRSGPG
ncbi:MAG TPA: hypothetical protein VFK54_06785 [Candidatus Limnocylindrales bacterium]|nr:hypothetical protein [Candidatus Limnocylindrales bacterium]